MPSFQLVCVTRAVLWSREMHLVQLDHQMDFLKGV